MKSDIANREDIQLLVNSFYDKVKVDETIGFIFSEIMQVNWEKHLPTMYDFWESTLFFTGGYHGNTMHAHRKVHDHFPLQKEHFARWLSIFKTTVDEIFEGEKATLAKQRAESIATALQIKLFHPDPKSLL